MASSNDEASEVVIRKWLSEHPDESPEFLAVVELLAQTANVADVEANARRLAERARRAALEEAQRQAAIKREEERRQAQLKWEADAPARAAAEAEARVRARERRLENRDRLIFLAYLEHERLRRVEESLIGLGPSGQLVEVQEQLKAVVKLYSDINTEYQ